MTEESIGTRGDGSGRKLYSVKVQAKAHSSTGCSFCWFVVSAYPRLDDMTPNDRATYRAHLERSHGLREEITP